MMSVRTQWGIIDVEVNAQGCVQMYNSHDISNALRMLKH